MPTTPETTPRALPGVFLGGMLMGAADIVPGVSGGTVALLLGIYQRLVGNIRAGAGVIGALVQRQPVRAFRRLGDVEWTWLVALIAGILLSVALLATTIEHQLESNPVGMSGLFLGLVVGSAVIAAGDVGHWRRQEVLLAVAATVVTFLALGVRPAVVHDPSPLVFAAAGAVAICAMILPGVSGSFLLLTLGMYEPLLAAANGRDLAPLVAFVAGAAVGLAAFSTLLAHALSRWHDLLLALLIGLMVGSARVLWPWPAGEGVGDARLGAPDGQVLTTFALMVVGFLVVLAIAHVARRHVD